MAEPPVAWPVSVEPRPAAPDGSEMEEDGSERAGLGFSPPAQAGYSVDPLGAMAAAPEPSTPPARDQVPEPPRPSKRPIPQPMEEPTSKAPTLPGFTRASAATPCLYWCGSLRTTSGSPCSRTLFRPSRATWRGSSPRARRRRWSSSLTSSRATPSQRQWSLASSSSTSPSKVGHAGEGLDTEISEGLRQVRPD